MKPIQSINISFEFDIEVERVANVEMGYRRNPFASRLIIQLYISSSVITLPRIQNTNTRDIADLFESFD